MPFVDNQIQFRREWRSDDGVILGWLTLEALYQLRKSSEHLILPWVARRWHIDVPFGYYKENVNETC